MKVYPTEIVGVHVVETTPYSDRRGAFARLFCASELGEIIGQRSIVQINHSSSKAVGSIRGMHFQNAPHAEMKLVRCLKGRVWDVAVDLRAGSPTFRQWHAEELTPLHGRMLVIPEGCAHGFQVLERDSELLYLHTEFYTPSMEGGVRFDDPLLDVMWPLPVTELSERDRDYPFLSMEFRGLTV